MFVGLGGVWSRFRVCGLKVQCCSLELQCESICMQVLEVGNVAGAFQGSVWGRSGS